MARTMSPLEIEPLEPDLWFKEVRAILDRTTALDGEAPDAIIRKSYYLTQLAPQPLKPLISVTIDEERFEYLLEGGAYDEAVLALINPILGMALTRLSREAMFQAEVRLPDGDNTGVATGETIAKALIAAWANCLVSLGTRIGYPPTGDAGLHRFRSSKPPRLTKH